MSSALLLSSTSYHEQTIGSCGTAHSTAQNNKTSRGCGYWKISTNNQYGSGAIGLDLAPLGIYRYRPKNLQRPEEEGDELFMDLNSLLFDGKLEATDFGCSKCLKCWNAQKIVSHVNSLVGCD